MFFTLYPEFKDDTEALSPEKLLGEYSTASTKDNFS